MTRTAKESIMLDALERALNGSPLDCPGPCDHNHAYQCDAENTLRAVRELDEREGRR